MNIEIVNVGTELLLGEIVNTNATELQKICKQYGHVVYYQTVVGDNVERIEDTFQLAFSRGADCIITTGGIGPTEDDLTKEISAKVLGLELVYNEEEAKLIYDKCSFVGHSKQIALTNYKQAYYPSRNCLIINNQIGTANGCVMWNDKNQRIINLPGPPKELRWCIEHFLKDYLAKEASDQIYTKDITCMGIGESQMAQDLAQIVNEQDEVTIAIYAHEDFNRVRLGYKCKSSEEAKLKFAPVEKQIKEVLKDYLIDLEEMRKKIYEIPFQIRCNFDFNLDFLQVDENATNLITIQRVKKELGDEVIVSYKDHTFSAYLLYDALLNQPKLQSNIINHLYRWIYLGEN